MSVAIALAMRVQAALDEIAALKERTPAEIEAEERLHDRLGDVFGPLIARVQDSVEARGLPTNAGVASLTLGPLDDIAEQLLTVLSEEVGDVAAEAIAHVEEVVAAARKALPDLIGVRPYGMDRQLFDTIGRLGGRMLDRFTSRTLDALVAAAEVGLPADQVRGLLGEMLQGELTSLSRHALGDARNEATEVAEVALGVTHHMWVTAGDDEVRPAHADVHGEVVRLGETFSNGWRRPGGVGCRCHLEPVISPPVAA